MSIKAHASALERLYERYNRRSYVSPDPLEFLYRYADPADQEVVGLIASCLAYGRVRQICASVERVLRVMDGRPARFLLEARAAELTEALEGFKHRFCKASHLQALLRGVQAVLRRHGSLQECFRACVGCGDRTVMPALGKFVDRLRSLSPGDSGHLLPQPAKASACKRLHLFLRWMVRRDDVDLGCWDCVSPSMLIVPLDTHMHRICLALGATDRKAADLAAAMQATEAFRRIRPQDPVRYDFALTRLGIHPQADLEQFLRRCRS